MSALGEITCAHFIALAASCKSGLHRPQCPTCPGFNNLSSYPNTPATLENKHFFPDNTLVTTTTHTGRDLTCDREGTLCSHASRLETLVGRSYWTGKRVIDLGSGIGVVGNLLRTIAASHTMQPTSPM